jgi:hypothetical protein
LVVGFVDPALSPFRMQGAVDPQREHRWRQTLKMSRCDLSPTFERIISQVTPVIPPLTNEKGYYLVDLCAIIEFVKGAKYYAVLPRLVGEWRIPRAAECKSGYDTLVVSE